MSYIKLSLSLCVFVSVCLCGHAFVFPCTNVICACVCSRVSLCSSSPFVVQLPWPTHFGTSVVNEDEPDVFMFLADFDAKQPPSTLREWLCGKDVVTLEFRHCLPRGAGIGCGFVTSCSVPSVPTQRYVVPRLHFREPCAVCVTAARLQRYISLSVMCKQLREKKGSG